MKRLATVMVLMQVAGLCVVAAQESTGGDPLLVEALARIAARVEALRGETFDDPPSGVRVPDELRGVAAEIRAFTVLDRDRLAARGRAWSDVGLGEADAPRKLLLALATDVGEIGYDPRGNRLLVTPGRLPAGDFEPTAAEDDPATIVLLTGMQPDEPLVSHLLMHVRQLERSGSDALRPTTDRLLASMAWAEGEANFVAVRYLFAGMRLGEDAVRLIRDPGEVTDGALVPPGLDDGTVHGRLLSFIYRTGYEIVARRFADGGWPAVDAAMTTRRTARDLLHPDLAPLRDAAFPEPPTAPREGLVAIDVDTLGEQAIVALVARWTGKDSLGLVAGEGWAGDRLMRWEPRSGTGPGVTEWLTRWTGVAGHPPREATTVAEDFVYALARALEARFAGRELSDAGDGSRVLVTADRLYRVRRSGAEVRVLISPLEAGPEPD